MSIDLWRVDLTKAPPLAELWKGLDKSERWRAQTYLVAEAGRRFAVSRAMLKIVLRQYVANPVIRTGLRGKPQILGGWRFSVSHSEPWLLIAVSRRNVGVDVERAQVQDEIVDRWFTPDERRAYRESKRRPTLFARMWSRKEALGKAMGSGVPQVLRGELEGRWVVHEVKVAPGFAGALAVEE